MAWHAWRWNGLALLLLGTVGLLAEPRISVGQSPEPVKVPIGTKIDAFEFKDIRYLPRSLRDFPDKKAFVIVFTATGCPLVSRYMPALKRLDEEFGPQGVQVLALNVGADDSIRDIAEQALEHGVAFPFVKCFTGDCARKLGVTRTPEAVVLDAEFCIRYRGRINDQYRLGGVRPQPTREDLREAILDVLAGKPVRVATTPVDGCSITMPTIPEPAQPVTYADHIGPLLRKHCVECHRPNTPAPFSLLTFEQAAGKATMINEVVQEQRMPPWFASDRHGEFVNRRQLTAAERLLVAQWLQGGKQPGDLTKLPPLPPEVANPPSRWVIGGEPDLVLKLPEHSLPADGDVAYKYAVIPYVFAEDTWIQHLQILPDNPKVLHHANLAYMVVGEKFSMNNFITGYVPGGEPMRLYDGVGFRIPKGSLLVMQIHYVTIGQPQKCQIAVGIRYAKEPIQKQLRFKLLADYRFAIPPGAPAHRVTNEKEITDDIVGIGLFVHMHLRGRDMTFRVRRPGAEKSDTLLVVPNYNFNWQMPYRWAQGAMKFPKGTRIEAIAHYDNSAFNPYNPDPKATVRNGDQTYEEMMNGFFFYVLEHERLNLTIDPKTGHVVKAAAAK